jgi:squalene-associated FAD-dependent desaturase
MPSAFDAPRPKIAIIGGGLAGLSAAVAAVERDMHVELFERSKTLGGRAGSSVDPQQGQLVDYCQHVAMGCCTEFLDFCRRTGSDDCFARARTLHFIGPDGRQHDFTPSRWLPPPLHLLPGLLRMNYLSWAERCSIMRAMRKLVSARTSSTERENRTIGAWLRQHGQSPQAIERFWSVVLVSALGETVERASLAAAQKVFRDGFWAARDACELVLPRRPLQDIFHDRVGKWLTERGAILRLDTSIRQIEGTDRRAALIQSDGTRRTYDAVIVAVPWRDVRALFADDLLAQMPALAEVERIEPAAITAVHLWYDRPLTALPHAVLVSRLSQWLFAEPCGAGVPPASLPAGETPAPQHYYQVVISASHRLPRRTNEQWLAAVRADLAAVWPAARQANLLHSRVVTLPAAVFSVTPELDQYRPLPATPLENVWLAGDWTATGWPATMEGAVRSGRQAVEALLRGIAEREHRAGEEGQT